MSFKSKCDPAIWKAHWLLDRQKLYNRISTYASGIFMESGLHDATTCHISIFIKYSFQHATLHLTQNFSQDVGLLTFQGLSFVQGMRYHQLVLMWSYNQDTSYSDVPWNGRCSVSWQKELYHSIRDLIWSRRYDTDILLTPPGESAHFLMFLPLW